MPGSILTGKFAHFSGQCAPNFHIFHRNTGEIQGARVDHPPLLHWQIGIYCK
jgi:hypothetical protein